MKRLLATMMALLLTTGLLVGAAHAQEGSAAAAAADTLRSGAVQQQGAQGQAPASVVQVRRRIRSLGPGRTVRRVIHPIIVVPQVQVHMVDQEGRLVVPRTPPPVSSPFFPGRDSDRYYYDSFGTLRDRETGEPVRVRISGGEADTAAVDSLAAPFGEPGDTTIVVVQPPPQPPPPQLPRERPPTARQVERSILETGLFRTIGVNFEFDQSALLPEAEATLGVVGQVMQDYPELRFEIAGHTDAVGLDAYNQTLSARRAASVKRYLVERFGIEEGRLQTRGYGESEPVATNATATGRTLNRRVEFRVLNPGAAEQIRQEIIQGDRQADEQLRESLRRLIRQEIRRMQGRPDTTQRR